MSFTNIKFIRDGMDSTDRHKEYFLISSETATVEILHYTFNNAYNYARIEDRDDKLTYDVIDGLRTELIADTKQQRKVQIAKVNLIRDKFHPDIIPLIVNLLNDLIPIHYLETV